MKTPPKLALLLDIVNSLPKRPETVLDRETLEAVLSEAPDAFCHFIAPNGLATNCEVDESIERLLEAATWRDALESFVFLAHTEKNVTHRYRQKGKKSLAIYCDEQGRIQLKENPFTEAVKEGIEAARVSECANHSCQRLFFKGRADQKGCSSTCSAVLRTRKWREKTTEQQRQTYNKAKAKARKKRD